MAARSFAAEASGISSRSTTILEKWRATLRLYLTNITSSQINAARNDPQVTKPAISTAAPSQRFGLSRYHM